MAHDAHSIYVQVMLRDLKTCVLLFSARYFCSALVVEVETVGLARQINTMNLNQCCAKNVVAFLGTARHISVVKPLLQGQ